MVWFGLFCDLQVGVVCLLFGWVCFAWVLVLHRFLIRLCWWFSFLRLFVAVLLFVCYLVSLLFGGLVSVVVCSFMLVVIRLLLGFVVDVCLVLFDWYWLADFAGVGLFRVLDWCLDWWCFVCYVLFAWVCLVVFGYLLNVIV